jgi:hypothetical protein
VSVSSSLFEAMHVHGASFCCLCLKTNQTDGMFSCVECVRLEAGLSKGASGAPSSFCSSKCFSTHFGACHRPAGVASDSKRPSSGSSSSGSDPGSPPSSYMHGRGMQQQLSPLPMPLHYQQQHPGFYHHPSPPPTHRRGSGDGRHYQQQRSRRA